VHVHGVLRTDGVGDDFAPPPSYVSARDLCEAIVRAGYAAKVSTTLYGEKVTVDFGEQIAAEPLEVDGQRKVSYYVANYAECLVMPSLRGSLQLDELSVIGSSA
jgi:hypothetical protein